jgi:hypothetical protein
MKLLPEGAPERRRALALLAVLAALVAWVWWPAGTGPAGPAPPPSAPTGDPQAVTAAGGRAPGPASLPARVRLDLLERQAGGIDVGRNLFRFGARPAPPPPPPVEAPEPVEPLPPPAPPGPPPVPLRLTGRFESPDGRVVVTLKDPGTGALFHASEGDIVDGRYRLIKVGVQSAVVAYLDGSGQRTIALGGG